MLLACQVQRASMAKMPLEGKQAQKGALKRHRVVYNRSKDTTPMLIKTQSRMHACRMEQKSLFLFCPPFFLPSKKKGKKKETHVRYTFSCQNHTDHTIPIPTQVYMIATMPRRTSKAKKLRLFPSGIEKPQNALLHLNDGWPDSLVSPDVVLSAMCFCCVRVMLSVSTYLHHLDSSLQILRNLGSSSPALDWGTLTSRHRSPRFTPLGSKRAP